MAEGNRRSDPVILMKKFLLLCLSAAFLSGCAMSDPFGASAQRKGVMCTGCGSVWVAANAPAGKPGMFAVGSMHKHRPCSFCAQMAQKYLTTGKLEGTCPNCGKSMRSCLVQVRPAPVKKSS